MNFSIETCRIIDLPKINDIRGNLTFIEGGSQIPFDIKRVYYLYDQAGLNVEVMLTKNFTS